MSDKTKDYAAIVLLFVAAVIAVSLVFSGYAEYTCIDLASKGMPLPAQCAQIKNFMLELLAALGAMLGAIWMKK